MLIKKKIHGEVMGVSTSTALLKKIAQQFTPSDKAIPLSVSTGILSQVHGRTWIWMAIKAVTGSWEINVVEIYNSIICSNKKY